MQVSWFDNRHLAGLVPLAQAVAASGGAVGWLDVPPPAEVLAWATSVVASGSRLAVAEDDEQVLACGYWQRYDAAVLREMGHIRRVMTHPGARGRGVGRAVVQALVADARTAGIELITLDCRGNNHGALRLYASLGFVVTGRRPDAIAVGNERFDQVLMHLDLREGPAGLVRHGSLRDGPGAT